MAPLLRGQDLVRILRVEYVVVPLYKLPEILCFWIVMCLFGKRYKEVKEVLMFILSQEEDFNLI